MTGARVLYFILLVVAGVFNFFYDAQVSLYIFIFFLLLPFLSLVVSLPSMLSCKPVLNAPDRITSGDRATLHISLKGQLLIPCGSYRFSLIVSNTLSGEIKPATRIKILGFSDGGENVELPNDHCGCVRISLKRIRVSDMLCLWSIPKRCKQVCDMYVLPRKDETIPLPEGLSSMIGLRKPKPGGGYSEEHELRPFRQGDSVRSIHWKLSSKLDDVIIREPITIVEQRIMVTLLLYGGADALDKVLTSLVMLSSHIIESGLGYTLRVPTADGATQYISSERNLMDFLKRIMLIKAPESGEGLTAEVHGRVDRHFILKPQTETDDEG
ncbi:MAG TPA: DUF58 domain-containing protein [Eubacteriales bacterium]|nr:DUF58 domain-containing protein [Clostridia bacterium]HRV72677.1 DUF58 domain-containing protein [Eubacteriales bacterium]